MRAFVDILLPLPLNSTYTYSADESNLPKIGSRVLVPFQSRKIAGIVTSLHSVSPTFEVKPIDEVLDEVPILTADQIELINKISLYYGVPKGEVLQTLLPAGVVKQSRRKIFVNKNIHSNIDLSSESLELLQYLQKRSPVDFVRLLKKKPQVFPHLQELLKNNFVSIATVLEAERVKEKTETIYQKLFTSLPETKSKKVRQINDLLSSREISHSEFKQSYPTLLTTLRQLVKKGWVSTRSISSDKPIVTVAEEKYFDLNEFQKSALDTIVTAILNHEYQEFLLYGVTGSGKTEVYIRAAQKALEIGRTVLALVPEIALTPQFVGRFRSRLGSKVAILHSGLSERERFTQWRRILKGEALVVVGARSAVFAPLVNIGLLLIDEEHDTSYKQHEGLLYDARLISKWRAQTHGAAMVLGSATPAIETYHRAQKNKSSILCLPGRASGQSIPQVEIVDLKSHQGGTFLKEGILTTQLKNEIELALQAKRQVLLFLNRRGFAPTVICPSCGDLQRCTHCSVGLAFHSESKSLVCHYCGFTRDAYGSCPSCKHDKLVFLGIGTESVEAELRRSFPDAVVDRMDRDSMSRKDAHDLLFQRLTAGDIDILVGTQMVTKGLDIENIGLVGVLLADQGLHLPDFRSSEKTFSLISQVVGRSGRGKTAGKAIVQTFLPEHPAISLACKQDFEEFYKLDLWYREKTQYPPFVDLYMIKLEGKNESTLKAMSAWFGRQLASSKQNVPGILEVLGPVPAPVAKIKTVFRYQILIKTHKHTDVHPRILWLVEKAKSHLNERNISVFLDVDPQHFV